MVEEPQAATPRTRPKRRYTVSATNRRNLEKARAVPKEIRDRRTERRRVACRQNLRRRGLGNRSAIGPTRAWPPAVGWRVGWPGGEGGQALRGRVRGAGVLRVVAGADNFK